MPDKVVLDSSILAAMFFKEEASSRALKCVAECDPVTLDLAVAEVGNVAWKQVVFSGESKDRALDALRDGQDFITTTCTLLKASDLTAKAFEIAVEDVRESESEEGCSYGLKVIKELKELRRRVCGRARNEGSGAGAPFPCRAGRGLLRSVLSSRNFFY